jgi:hypothetical protein
LLSTIFSILLDLYIYTAERKKEEEEESEKEEEEHMKGSIQST